MSRPNVLLVVADSLRARNVSALGYRRETTPFLESFAEAATVYTQARSPSNWTLPSHVSLFSGHAVGEHGFDIDHELDPGHTVFEELATDHGYRTGLFSDNPFLTDHESGLDRAFETVATTPDDFDDGYATDGDLGDWPNGFYYADEFLSWVDGVDGDGTDGDDDPWAACINLMDTHRPYEPLDEYDRWSDPSVRALQEEMGFKWHWEFLSGSVSLGFAKLLESIYDGAVRQVDAICERLVTGLAERDALEDTLVVVTSDHGEGFGDPTALDAEPPAVSHRIGTHDVMYHVPLVVRAPGQRRARRVHDLAHLTAFPDVVRTLVREDRGLDGAGFVADDGRAVAAQAPITGAMRREAERICGSAAPFAKRAELVYEDRPGDRVRKRARWGEDAYETLIRGRNEADDRGSIAPETVDADRDDALGPEVSVSTRNPDYSEFAEDYKNEFQEDLESRLEALGYR